MIDIIKFSGKDKRESIRRATTFYYDNLDGVGNNTLELFLARCRVQSDKTTIYYYPNMKIDLKRHRELKKRKKDK